MSQKLSMKVILSALPKDRSTVAYDTLHDQLVEAGVSLNEPMLKGTLLQMVERGRIVADGDGYRLKPKAQGGVSVPTELFRVKTGKTGIEGVATVKFKPELDGDGVHYRTPLQALKAEKTKLYNAYWEQLTALKAIIAEHQPGDDGEGTEAESGDEQAA